MPIEAVESLVRGILMLQEYIAAIVSLSALVAALCNCGIQRYLQRGAQAHDHIQAQMNESLVGYHLGAVCQQSVASFQIGRNSSVVFRPHLFLQDPLEFFLVPRIHSLEQRTII